MAGQVSPRVLIANTDPVTFQLAGTDAFKATLVFYDAAGDEIVATALAQGTREVAVSSTVACRDTSADPDTTLLITRQETAPTTLLDSFDWKDVDLTNSMRTVTFEYTGNGVVTPGGAITYAIAITAPKPTGAA